MTGSAFPMHIGRGTLRRGWLRRILSFRMGEVWRGMVPRLHGIERLADDGKRFAEVNGVNELRGTFHASAGRAKAS